MKLKVITSNPGKVEEYRRSFSGLGIEMEHLRQPYDEVQTSDLSEVVSKGMDEIMAKGVRDFIVDDSGLFVDALKGFPDNRIVLKTKKGDGIYQKIDIFKGLMWYSYPFDRNNMMAIPAEKVNQIIVDNKKGVFPEQLEDFAFIKEQKNNDYGEEGKPADLSKLE